MMSMIAALATVAATTVKSTTGPIIAAGTWTGVIIVSVGAIVAYVRIMPKLREINVTARLDEMQQMGDRIRTLEESVKDANKAIAAANQRAHVSETKYTTLAAAVELMLGELEHLDPGNHVIKQVRNLVALAASSDAGVGDGLLKLMSVKGVGET